MITPGMGKEKRDTSVTAVAKFKKGRKIKNNNGRGNTYIELHPHPYVAIHDP